MTFIAYFQTQLETIHSIKELAARQRKIYKLLYHRHHQSKFIRIFRRIVLFS